MTPAKTATRPAVEELPMGEPLPDELQIAPPAPPVVEQILQTIPVSLIRPAPHNPRRDLGELDGLVASIHAVGILEPLVVECYSGPLNVEPYLLLAGHRRLAAAKLAGLTEVPCIVRATAATPALRLEMALVENLQREGLAPLDEADGYLELTKLGLSQRKIAERVGCSQSHVSKRLGLLELPSHVQKRVEKGTMPLEAAAALTRLKDHPEKLKKAAGEDPSRIVYAVERAEEEIAWEAKVAELREVAKGKKWKVVEEPRDHWAKRSFKTLAKWGYDDRELDLDVRRHQSEPCHAVMIPKHRSYYNDKPSATSVCTDPSRHGPKGDSEIKVKAAPKLKRQPDEHEVREAQERQDRKAAAGARAVVLAKALADYAPKGPTSAELRMTLRACVTRNMGWDSAQLACELLGLEVRQGPGSGEAYGALDRYASELVPLQLHRVALALAFAVVEVGLRGHYGRYTDKGVAEHYAYLMDFGYEPSPWEKAQLVEATEKVETSG